MRGPDGGHEARAEDIVSIESCVICEHCGQPLSWGNMYYQHRNTQAVYHRGCMDAVAQNNLATKLLCDLKAWRISK